MVLRGLAERIDLALTVLDCMRSSAVEINIRHWNPLIFECSKTDWQKSLELLRSAQETEAEPDIQSFTSILNAASRVASWSLAVAVLGAMLSSSVQAGVAAYNIAISSCKSHWILAPQLLDNLTTHGLLPDVITHSTTTAVMTAGEVSWSAALLLFGAGVQRDVTCFGATVAALNSYWPGALDLLDMAGQGSVTLSQPTQNAALGALAEALEWTRALCQLGDPNFRANQART